MRQVAPRFTACVCRSCFSLACLGMLSFGMLGLLATSSSTACGQEVARLDTEGQPLAANIKRVIEALEFIGQPLSDELTKALLEAGKQRQATTLQKLLDQHVAFVVSLNPEVRVKVQRGPAKAELQQGGFTPLLVKILNESTVTRQMRIASPQSGSVYAGAALGTLQRQAQTELNDNENTKGATDRFLEVEMFERAPMTNKLSGLTVEYAICLIHSSEPGKREATIQFDVGAGTQDLGFRADVPVLFDIKKSRPVKLSIKDFDGASTTARLTLRDKLGRVYPPQAKRLAPDFFFQPQIYRHDGEVLLLPPGDYIVESCRGPEYHVREQILHVPSAGAVSAPTAATAPGADVLPDIATASVAATLDVKLERWINPMKFGFYCGDHHIHGAGCSHYTSPTEGVTPQDMFRQVKGEGLNVGCVLTWGPCFEFQRNYFNPEADTLSESLTLMKYDIEVSGFGSAALGHVCLLNLNDQNYPGSDGTKTKGWPTWTVPVLKWCKDQGGVTGYPHSALSVNAEALASRLLELGDADKDGTLNNLETANASVLLPEPFQTIDEDRDGKLTVGELVQSGNRAANTLPNFAIPGMDGGGAMEICVSTAEGVCDFISAMDTARIPEWNTWYHLMNCGFPLKLSGETDFPCMSSRRVGQGRVYVQLGETDQLHYGEWCNGIAQGRSYVTDGFAHALNFTVDGEKPGHDDVKLVDRQHVTVETVVSFAPRTPIGVAYGNEIPAIGQRMVGDTVNLHAPRSMEYITGGKRKIEVVVNGVAVDSVQVPADGKTHALKFKVPVTQSSWVAIRHFPQLHTNPVNVIVDDKPIRASKQSARWCIESIKLLWKNRNRVIVEAERDAAKAAYDRSIKKFEAIELESRN